MNTDNVSHSGLTHIFTQVCEDKTDWDIAPMLYVIEREPENPKPYYLTPLPDVSNDMLHVAENTRLPFPIILDRFADFMEHVNERHPEINPAGQDLDFIGFAYTCEAFKTICDPDTGEPIDQPTYSDDLNDNPNSIEIFTLSAYTVDNLIHGHTIERQSRDYDHYCEPMTENHEIARIPVTLRRMVNALRDTNSKENHHG